MVARLLAARGSEVPPTQERKAAAAGAGRLAVVGVPRAAVVVAAVIHFALPAENAEPYQRH